MKLDHQAARARIKRHLKLRGSESVVLSVRLIYVWWRVLNRAVFYNKLDRPADILLIRHKKEWGWAVPLLRGAIRLTIQPTFNSRELFLNVLVHEMVHAWEHLHNNHMSHGPRFNQWYSRIKRTTTLTLSTSLHDVDKSTIHS